MQTHAFAERHGGDTERIRVTKVLLGGERYLLQVVERRYGRRLETDRVKTFVIELGACITVLHCMLQALQLKIFDFGAVVRTDNQTAETEAFTDGNVRAVRVKGDDGVSYTVVSNFGIGDAEFSAFGIRRTLSAGEYAVFAGKEELRGNTAE